MARSLNEVLPEPKTDKGSQEGLSPGQDYDARGDLRGLLERHGWTFKGNTNDGREKWTRPGKERGKGGSATLTDGKVFYVFSSNAHPLEPGLSYGPFGGYGTLEHGGDFSKAARALANQGYGTKQQQKKGRKAKFMDAAAMEREFGKEIEWLWRDHIPKANPVLYAGREGEGKSSDVVQTCKEIVLSNPKFWVLWVACEGFVSDHSDKWRKLKIPYRVVMLSDDKGVYKLQLDKWADQVFLDQALQDLKLETGGQVVAVVIDSIRGMQSIGENDPQMASLMSMLNSIICDKHKAACIYIAHHKKGLEPMRLNKVSGSTSITSSVRAVYALERISECVCTITPDKANALGHNPKTYKSVLIEKEGGSYEISIIEGEQDQDATQTAKAEKFLISLFRQKAIWMAAEIYRPPAPEAVLTTSEMTLESWLISNGLDMQIVQRLT